MKLKTALPFIFAILLFSCVDLGSFDDRPYVGIGIDIVNLTNKEYDNLKLHIGGVENDTFISTDIFELPTIIVRPNKSFTQKITFDESRWQTDLKKILEISNNAYFALEFTKGKQILLENFFITNELINFSVLDRNGTIKNKYGGRLSISIKGDKEIVGRFREDNHFK